MKRNLILLILLITVISGFYPTLQVVGINEYENQWSTVSPMPTARGYHGIAEVDGKIFCIGGRNETGIIANNEAYDVLSDTWSVKTPMPTARSSFAITVYQNKIYCIGGIMGDIDNPEPTGLTEVYDPNTDSWETKRSMSSARSELCANVVNNAIYLIGGKQYQGIEQFFQEVTLNEVYFPDNDSWTTKSPMFIPVFGYMSSVIEDKILIIGGARQFQEKDTGVAVQFNQMYDPKIDAWRNLAGIPTGKSHAASALTKGTTAPSLLYCIGGLDQRGYSNINYAYNIKQNNWTIAEPMPTARAHLGLIGINDVFYAIGGFDGNKWLDINELYKPLNYGTVPPKLTLLSPENKTYASNNVSLILSVNRPTNWIRVSLNGKENMTLSEDNVLSGLSEGEHKLIIYINDTFGNEIASDNILFSIDTKPPIISVLSPENKSYGELDIQSTIIINEPVSWIGYSLDGQETTTIKGNVTLAVLSEGDHNIIFYATDLVGNNGNTETIYFNIAQFPILIVIMLVLIIIIIIMAIYLFLNRKK